MRIGIGYDIHRLVPEKKLILGGVEIPFEKGLLGHSDADVLTHAICDAILGAAALGDLGSHFSDADPVYKMIDSQILLKDVKSMISDRYSILNIDSVVICEKPRLAGHIPEMRKKLAETLHISIEKISVKATTAEKLDSIGKGKSIGAQAIVLLKSLE